MPMRRNVPHDEPEREFTREGADVNWFDEGKDTLDPAGEADPHRHPLGRGAALAHLPHGLERPDRRRAAPMAPRPAEVAVKSRFLVYRNRVETETDFLVGKREDVLRRVDGGWRIARRKIVLDQSVLLAKNLTVFF